MSDTAKQTRPRPAAARIAPIPRMIEKARAFNENGLVSPIHLTATLAHAVPVSKAVFGVAETLFDPKLIDPRLREIVILRTGWNTHSVYEWGQHVMAARKSGLDDGEIRATQRAISEGPWTALEAASLRMVDDLCADDCVGDATWADLSAATDVQTAIALIALCGYYRLVAGLLNSLGIEPEPGLPGWDLQPTDGSTT